ncbi:hypothetical protein [Flavivirga aquatica]|uniref:hypothetical protein n=1 Tax=Flavivirga aquatica TaxID=1849968 RepID=UPI00196B89E5|nr:hypothetical protein [Flavivirga aquatica]
MKNNVLKTILFATIASVFIACNNDDDSTNNLKIPDLANFGIKLPYNVLKTVNNVEIRNGGFGSEATIHPTNAGEFYALTDREQT